MESKFDYITLTLKSKEKDLDDSLNVLSNDLLLGDLISKMVFKGRVGYYDYRLEYENISFLFTDPERFSEQGICLKFSSQGLDYFNRYLATYGLTLKQWLGKWRSLAFDDYISKCTRIDYAMDDIVTKDGCPTITMSQVFRAANNNEICKKARTVDILCGADISSRERIKYSDGKPIRGRTLYIGVRESDKVVRFYDKLAEQIQRKRKVPKDVTHWTRCEVEFHDGDAMSVLNAFLDYSDEQFSEHMRGVVNNQCRFIVRNNDNVSRCPSKRWWTAFLNGCTKCFKLPHKKPARSALARAERGLSQYVRILYTLYQLYGLEGLYRYFEDEVNKLKAKNKDLLKPDIIANLLEENRDYEEMTAAKHYLYNSDLSEDELKEHVDYDRMYYRRQYLLCSKGNYARMHSIFMTGQEVLLDGL